MPQITICRDTFNRFGQFLQSGRKGLVEAVAPPIKACIASHGPQPKIPELGFSLPPIDFEEHGGQ